MDSPRVLVTQSGARHNYALPAAFAEADMLEAFFTDICGGRGLGRLADIAAGLPLPGSLGNLSRRLSGRRPPADVLARTHTDAWATLRYEWHARRETSARARRELTTQAFVDTGKRMAGWGLGDATHLFNIFGYGGELVEQANARGIPVLSDIVIALSTRRITLDEYERFPEWGPPPPDPEYSEIEGYNFDRHLLSTTDIFVCPSAFVADDLVDNWGIDRSRTRIAPYALKSDWFSLEPRPVPGRVLFVGSAERRKGIHYLAFASQIAGKDLEFRVAGHVDEQIRSKPQADRLNFLGRVPRDLIQDEFATADVFVLPTLAEGSATVVYEAMAAGLPVVTTKAAGSVIRDGIDGLIVPERDPDALAEAIEWIVGNRELRQSMSEAARENARNWGWETYAASLRQIVQDTPSPIENRRSYRAEFDSNTGEAG